MCRREVEFEKKYKVRTETTEEAEVVAGEKKWKGKTKETTMTTTTTQATNAMVNLTGEDEIEDFDEEVDELADDENSKRKIPAVVIRIPVKRRRLDSGESAEPQKKVSKWL